jgi:hypothetical protein
MNSINKITKSIEKYNNKKLQSIFETAKANNITCIVSTYLTNRFGHITEVADDCLFFKDHGTDKEFQYYFKDMDITKLVYCEETGKLYFYMFESGIDEYLDERFTF